MRLNFRTIKTLFRVEMRMVLRDRRMLLTSIVLPLLVTPLMFLGSTMGIKRHEKKLEEMVYPYAIRGEDASAVRSLVSVTRERLDRIALTNKTVFKFKEVTCEDAATALDKGDIQFILEGLPADQAPMPNAEERDAKRPGPSKTSVRRETPDEDEEPSVRGAPVVRIVFRGDRHESASGMAKMREALSETRRFQRRQLLSSSGFPVSVAQVAALTEEDVASKSQVAGLALGRTLTILLLVFILSSGAVVAIDSLAGEKERGTLETLLTTSAGRIEILASKHLVIVAIALLITCIQILNLLVYVHFKLLPIPANLASAVTAPVGLLLFLLYIPLAALAANVLLLVSGYARNYKEAQMWFLPVLLVGLVPAFAPCLPGLPLRSAAALVPIANLALAAKEILIGSFDWPMIALSWFTTAAAAVWTASLGVRSLVQEKLITASDADAIDLAGGPRLFERRVLRWFAVLWAALLLVSNYTGTLDIRLQILVNLVGLFFGACCLIIRLYRLDVRAALALRAPRPAVWLGVLLGIPGGFLTALGCFQLANLVIPAPAQITESFSQSVLPEHVPFFQILLFMTVLPGIFEEITFRGLFLYGLRRRLHPPLLAVVVGVAFGLFHVVLFRFVPTAALGIMFAAVTLLTGSIFPAMLWHAGSNLLGLLAYKLKFPENDLGAVCYVGGAGLLAIAFWIFWRHRTPYPDARWQGSDSRPRLPFVVLQ
jgi:ABC-type Na+ efflux pump permease subunit/membrane protease YdiL (CAAX protease family)